MNLEITLSHDDYNSIVFKRLKGSVYFYVSYERDIPIIINQYSNKRRSSKFYRLASKAATGLQMRRMRQILSLAAFTNAEELSLEDMRSKIVELALEAITTSIDNALTGGK